MKPFALAAGYAGYVRSLSHLLSDCESALDIACGSASPLRHVRRPLHLVGVDAHRPSLEKSREAGIHHEYIEADIRELMLEPGSFDAVLLLDVIEHLTEADARDLLDRAERIARRRVILATPNGFLAQDEYDGNPLQVHRSGWSVDAMEQMGYRVIGVAGHRRLRGELGQLRDPRLFAAALAALSQPFVWRRPGRAFELLAVKEVGGPAPRADRPRNGCPH